jgi:cytochrome P450
MSDVIGPINVGEQFLQHTHDVLSQICEHSPVRRIRFPDGGEGWLVTRYEDVKAISSDPRVSRDHDRLWELERIHMASSGAADDDPYGGYAWLYRQVVYTDPPDHTRLRQLVNKAFNPRAIDLLRPRIEQIADDLLDAMTGPGMIDLMPSFAVPLPMTAICELLGIPEPDRPNIRAWTILNGSDADADLPGSLREAAEYLGALVERKRADPGTDLLSRMVMASEDGDRLSREELISMALLILLAGHDTTVNLITNGTLALLRAPDQLALLRADPSLLPNAVEEIVRYDCPVNVQPPRATLEPIELGGIQIPAGEFLYVSILSANRDARQFDDPDVFDITRDTGAHIGFGYGIHYCLGAPLARMEGRIALGKLFARFPRLRLAAAPETLTYQDSTLMHGPVSLAVYLE